MTTYNHQQLADACGVSVRTIRRWANDERVDVHHPKKLWQRMRMMPDHFDDTPPPALWEMIREWNIAHQDEI